MIMHIALLGPSGAGKGTHVRNLTAQYGFFHICTGDLFRQNLENRTPLGLQAQSYMDRGELVPDELVDTMMAEHLRSVPSGEGILFDGFPRTPAQAKFLEECLRDLGRRLDAVIYLHVSDEEIVRRLSGRLVCHKCRASFHKVTRPFQTCPSAQCSGEHLYERSDDAPQTARARLRHFARATGPLLDFYQENGKLILIRGEDDLDKVGRAVIGAVEAVQRDAIRSVGDLAWRDVRAHFARSPVSPARAVLSSFDLVLFGAPGSGKGTQAERLAREFGLQHVATGDLFRENLKQETELGRLAKAYMDHGELVPDQITDAMVEERLSRSDTRHGFVLDGFPRNVHQAEALAEMLAERERKLAGVLYIKVSDDLIVGRLSGRWICRNCQTPYHLKFNPPAREGRCDRCDAPLYQRSDDHSDTVRARLKTFHAQTEPVLAYYGKSGLLVEVDGAGNVSQVAQATLAAAYELMPPWLRAGASEEIAAKA